MTGSIRGNSSTHPRCLVRSVFAVLTVHKRHRASLSLSLSFTYTDKHFVHSMCSMQTAHQYCSELRNGQVNVPCRLDISIYFGSSCCAYHRVSKVHAHTPSFVVVGNGPQPRTSILIPTERHPWTGTLRIPPTSEPRCARRREHLASIPFPRTSRT